MKKLLLLLSTLLVVLAGCSTVNPYSHEQQTAKSASGSLIGATAGAAIGALTASKKDRGKGALIGAAAGGALGGGIGYYMDVQEAKLRDRLASTGVSVTRNGNDIILNMPNSVTFDSNQSTVKPSGANALSGVAMILKEFNRTAVNVVGHTDSTGSIETNNRLSKQRAESVATNLITQGLESNRIRMYGAGPKEPIADNNSPEGRAQNRRVTLTLSPM